MSENIANKQTKNEKELTNWQKIDMLEAEIEKQKAKQRPRRILSREVERVSNNKVRRFTVIQVICAAIVLIATICAAVGGYTALAVIGSCGLAAILFVMGWYLGPKIKESAKKKHRIGMKFKRIFGDSVGQIVLTVLSIIWIIPLFYLFVQSFRKEPGAWSPTFFPKEWTLDNYKRLFTETEFLRWYGNTLLIAVCSCIITALFVLSVAYAFSRMKFKARKPMMNVMLILGMFPGFMSMSAVYFLLKILLPNNYQSHLSLIIVYSAGAALSYYIAKGFFDTVPKSLDEAARIDGASRFRTFYKIILPLSKSIIIYTILVSFISPWCDYIFVSYIMAGVPDVGMYTVSLGMYKWLEREMIQQYFTTFCAAAVIVATPITALFMWLQKYYVQGVTGGAVKG